MGHDLQAIDALEGHVHVVIHIDNVIRIDNVATFTTGWRRCIGCLKLQISFRQKATNFWALLQNMTFEDKAFSGSTPPCTVFAAGRRALVVIRIGTSLPFLRYSLTSAIFTIYRQLMVYSGRVCDGSDVN